MTGESLANEQELVEAAQKDPERFAELYELHFERVYAYIISRVRDRNEAQDLTSDVFYSALVNLKSFEWRGKPFGAWLIRIAANAIADHFQRLSKKDQVPLTADPPADTDLKELEDRVHLFRFVRTLPADQRRVIRMRFGEQKTVPEIARELQRTEGSVKQLQFRAIQTLRGKMRDQNA